jgi:hypothetical protein
VVSKSDAPKAAFDTYSAEVIKRANAKSNAMVVECVNRGEATLMEIVKNEVCHICHNRKESGLTFQCGRHTYCDMHCAVSVCLWGLKGFNQLEMCIMECGTLSLSLSPNCLHILSLHSHSHGSAFVYTSMTRRIRS